jgi:hypothetical protein
VTAAGETGESLACFDEIEAAGYADDLSSPVDLAAALAGALATHAGFAIDCAGDLAPRRRRDRRRRRHGGRPTTAARALG